MRAVQEGAMSRGRSNETKGTSAEALAAQALAMRKEADALWELGRKDESTTLHAQARALELRAQEARNAKPKG